ncbi:MAG TPA: carboxypeptidase regulatory-like domain-containing protein [Sphingobacterium sp.]|nr:carboxypeptidase regulatory-like domain-containing protein [Sphingobacterium sp.]
MRYLFLVFFFFSVHFLFAQSTGGIKGTVVDAEGQPLEKATVSVVSIQDSMVLSYSLTNTKGQFDIVRLPTKKDLSFFISHISSAPYEKKLHLRQDEKLDLGEITMGALRLDEIVVSYVPPIRLNGDTLEYKADYFKTKPNANVEELLQLLPGLQVNVDGTIYYQGKEVSSIRVNNKDFFAHDLTMATRNLDASLIDVVQVIRDKGESQREILDDSDLPIVINLKTKKNFVKADFGKFYGSGGTRDRYESGALVNTFRDTLQISFIGYANNLSRNGFDYSELSQYGGLGRAENNSFSYMSYGGLQNKISLGINANYDIGKKLKTNLMYSFEQQNDYVDNKGVQTNIYDGISERSNNNSNATYKDYRHQIRAFGRYAIDSTARVSMEVNLTFGKNTNDHSGLSNTLREMKTDVREGWNKNYNLRLQDNYRHSFYIEKKFSKSKILLSFRQNMSNGKADRDDNRTSWNRYYLLNDSIVDQASLTLTNTDNLSIGNSLNLQIPVRKDMNWDWYARYNHEYNRDLEDIRNKMNTDEFVDRNDVANNKQGRFGFTYLGTKLNTALFKKKLRFSVGLEWLNLDRAYHYYGQTADLNDTKKYWLPNASVSYDGFTFTYSKRVSLPSFYRIVAVDSDLYPTSLTIASPYFDNVVEQETRLRYFKSFKKIKMDFNASVGYTLADRSIGSQREYNIADATSVRTNYQTRGTDRLFGDMSFTQRFVQNKKWNISWRTNGYVSTNTDFSMVNGEENEGRRFYGNLNNTLTLVYKSKFTFIPTYGVNLSAMKNNVQSVNFQDVTHFAHSIGAVFRLDDIKKFRLETSYTVRNQAQNVQNDRINLHLLNSSLYYPILNRKGELKLTVYDLLNQNQDVWFSGYENTTNYMERLTLRQYFMFGVVYKFLTSGGKK